MRDALAAYAKRMLGDKASPSEFLSHAEARPAKPAATPSLREFLRAMRAEAQQYPSELTAQPIGTAGNPKTRYSTGLR